MPPVVGRLGWGIILFGLVVLALIAVASGVVSGDKILTGALFALFFLSHMFMHGGHGSHASRRNPGADIHSHSPAGQKARETTAEGEEKGHGCH